MRKTRQLILGSHPLARQVIESVGEAANRWVHEPSSRPPRHEVPAHLTRELVTACIPTPWSATMLTRKQVLAQVNTAVCA